MSLRDGGSVHEEDAQDMAREFAYELAGRTYGLEGQPAWSALSGRVDVVTGAVSALSRCTFESFSCVRDTRSCGRRGRGFW